MQRTMLLRFAFKLTMKYSTIYPITAAQITAQYRLTIDGEL